MVFLWSLTLLKEVFEIQYSKRRNVKTNAVTRLIDSLDRKELDISINTRYIGLLSFSFNQKVYSVFEKKISEWPKNVSLWIQEASNNR